MKNLSFRRAVASMIVAGVIGTSAFSAPVAARTVTGNAAGLSHASIQQTCPYGVSLEVQKQAHRPYQNMHPSDIPAGVISGLTFEALRVDGVDITTAAGWSAATGMSVGQAQDRGFEDLFTAVTDVEGIARFDENLPVGLYLIREITPANPHENHRTSRPFLSTLPVGDAMGERWLCDVKIKTKEKPEKPTTPPKTPPPPVTTTTPKVPPVTTTTPKVPPTPGVTTSTPPATTTQEVPPPVPDQPGRTPLAYTGANVLWLVALATLLIAGGAFLRLRRRG